MYFKTHGRAIRLSASQVQTVMEEYKGQQYEIERHTMVSFVSFPPFLVECNVYYRTNIGSILPLTMLIGHLVFV